MFVTISLQLPVMVIKKKAKKWNLCKRICQVKKASRSSNF